MTDIAVFRRRLAHEQALASIRIKGHQPGAEFLSDCEAMIDGTVMRDQARAASLERALSKDRAEAADLARSRRWGAPGVNFR